MKADYAWAYLAGREERLIKNDIDVEHLAEQVLEGKGTVHEVTRAAVSAAAKGLAVDRKKRDWIADYDEEIKGSVGSDSNVAYEHYLEGRIDELTSRLEDEVVEAIGEIVGDDGDDEDGAIEGEDEDELDDDAEEDE